MVALLWSVFNVLLLLLLLYAWFRVLLVLRREIGSGLTLVFALGLLLQGGSSGSTGPVSKAKNLLAPEPGYGKPANWSAQHSTTLTPLHQLTVTATGQRTASEVQPTGLYTSVGGWMLGHDWQPFAGMVHQTANGLSYEVVLLHEWKLLGARLYVTSEEHTGTLPTTAAR